MIDVKEGKIEQDKGAETEREKEEDDSSNGFELTTVETPDVAISKKETVGQISKMFVIVVSEEQSERKKKPVRGWRRMTKPPQFGRRSVCSLPWLRRNTFGPP